MTETHTAAASGAEGLFRTCGARTGDGPPCGQLAIMWEVGCVHEHVGRSPLCIEHAKRGEAGRAHCRNCRTIDGHECHLEILGPATLRSADSGSRGPDDNDRYHVGPNK